MNIAFFVALQDVGDVRWGNAADSGDSQSGSSGRCRRSSRQTQNHHRLPGNLERSSLTHSFRTAWNRHINSHSFIRSLICSLLVPLTHLLVPHTCSLAPHCSLVHSRASNFCAIFKVSWIAVLFVHCHGISLNLKTVNYTSVSLNSLLKLIATLFSFLRRTRLPCCWLTASEPSWPRRNSSPSLPSWKDSASSGKTQTMNPKSPKANANTHRWGVSALAWRKNHMIHSVWTHPSVSC